jgi:uncharacterized protein YndB with AHSA1/START domain
VNARIDPHLTMPWPRRSPPICEPELLASTRKRVIASPSERETAIERVFDAPPELVFRMWLEAKYLAQWWGPKGFTNRLYTLDPRPGGKLHIVMCAPDGTRYPMQAVFREIVVAERLALANLAEPRLDCSTVDGVTTVIFTERDGNTELTVRMAGSAPYPAAALEGIETSWKQSLDRLDGVVARASFLAPSELAATNSRASQSERAAHSGSTS